MLDIVKVIVKICQGEMTLFFPEYEERPGFIACWARVGEHASASVEYYREGIKPMGGRETGDALELMNLYSWRYGCIVQQVHKQSAKQRQKAWRQA